MCRDQYDWVNIYVRAKLCARLPGRVKAWPHELCMGGALYKSISK